VINFDIPKCQFTYLHRIGRSGRWGRKGMAINFVTKQDIYLMRRIEEYYSIAIEELPSNFSEEMRNI
jgi:superfamily II DNA/RNA helicase